MTEFSEKWIGLNAKLAAAQLSREAANNEVAAAELRSSEKYAIVTSIEQSLVETTLKCIANEDSESNVAWDYLETIVDHHKDSWGIIKARLPKLIQLQADPEELYVHVGEERDERGTRLSHATAFTASDTNVGVRYHRLSINSKDIAAHEISKALSYPEEQQLSVYQPITLYGGLIGTEEVKEFIHTIQNNPAHGSLMAELALELTTTSAGKRIYLDIPDEHRTPILDYAFRFIRYYPESRGDRFSEEVKTFPKAVELVLTEGKLKNPYSNNNYYAFSDAEVVEKLLPLYEPYLERDATLSPDDPDLYENRLSYVMSMAYSHHNRMSMLNWHSVDF